MVICLFIDVQNKGENHKDYVFFFLHLSIFFHWIFSNKVFNRARSLWKTFNEKCYEIIYFNEYLKYKTHNYRIVTYYPLEVIKIFKLQDKLIHNNFLKTIFIICVIGQKYPWLIMFREVRTLIFSLITYAQ